ncbi:MAG: hypothetical protein JZU65_19395 [Chlorobium sp.]|jgi:hypothetical protein|nr:hypothetical protein [Chlorobium sp.]
MNTPTESELREKLDRYERSLVTLKASDVKEIRLMFGSVAHMLVCDEIFPIAEFKRSYIQAIKSRIIELKYDLLKFEKQLVQ